MVVKWTFTDASTGTPEVHTFAVNPQEGGTPTRRKTITYQNTAAPDGKTLVFEGRDEPGSFSFNGVLLTQDEYDAFVYWFNKRHQILVEDDLGREFWIYITSFEATRERARHSPWKHRYVVEATVLDWDT